MTTRKKNSTLLAAASCLALAVAVPVRAHAADYTESYLDGVKTHHLATSAVPENGDQNPYAMAFVPATVGGLTKGDLLVDNFNNKGNLQGLGSTIISYSPATGKTTTFATIPANVQGCPGGVGLTTAMAVLKSGWVIVGSAPSTDGTSKTLGQGCLIILDSVGKVAGTITGNDISDPWGNMAWTDNGDSATLYVSNVGFGTGGANTAVKNTATVLRVKLSIADGKAPVVTDKTVIGSGFSSQPDASVFLIGPTGLALGKNGELFVSDAINNQVVKIDNADTRTDSAGTGTVVTKGGKLNRPLAMVLAPNGNLVVTNGLDGYAVEIDPEIGKQVDTAALDTDEAQTPPGSGDLFGIVLKPSGKGFYYVEDDVNTVVEAK
jgi:sugar lactone lactonase YvrE